MIRRSVVIDGGVQGVGFRWSARAEAERLGVVGWVRNRGDGTVEAEIEGADAAVSAMLDWLSVGPPGASVDAVVVREVALVGDGAFRIVR